MFWGFWIWKNYQDIKVKASGKSILKLMNSFTVQKTDHTIPNDYILNNHVF